MSTTEGRGTPTSSRLLIQERAYAPPPPIRGSGHARDVVVQVHEKWNASLSGSISMLGHAAGSEGLLALTLDQAFYVEGIHEFRSNEIDREISSPSGGVDFRRIYEALGTRTMTTGRAYGRAALRGPLRGERLRGHGSIEIPNG